MNYYAEKAQKGKVTLKEYKPISLEAQEKAMAEDVGSEVERIAAVPPIYYYHPDHLGTSTALTDFNGNAYQFFLNLPFGETMAQQLGSNYYNSPFKFNGKELDEETGFYYYGARYYDPKISIWLSVDPLAETSPNASPYNYCLNNPINMIDPDGQKERPNDYQGKMGKGDWKVDDRISNSDIWKNANRYNLQRKEGYKEYNSIEQRADFYKWFQHETDSKGFETNWAGAAHIVAMQMSNINGPFTSMIDNTVEAEIIKFANEGNKAIFENVFGKLKDLINGKILKGKEADKWDVNTLTIEQRDIVGPIYKKQRFEVLNELSKMAKGQDLYKHGVPARLRFNPKGNIRDWKQRFNHGMNVSLPYWNKYYSKRKR